MFNLDSFINTYVTRRPASMFADDLATYETYLSDEIQGKSVLVIGGAGSIGTSFIQTLLPFKPGELYIVDINENALTELTRSLRSDIKYKKFVPEIYLSYPMDYSSDVFRRMYIHHRRSNGCVGFDIVANFSAHKHVRSEKDIYSIEALLRNNVINAKGLLDLFVEHPPKVYFCVSTDKAANPVNIMGASKRIMEDLIFSYSDVFPVKTARFANVAFSNGSLPDGFLKRISKLQPLAAPSDVKRYFVSPEESGQICMLAAVLGKNREIFFPKLDEEQMMSFDSIAESLLKANGFNVNKCASEQEAISLARKLKEGSRDYPVYFSKSDTSGEKSFEEFYVSSETVDMDRFASLGVIVGKEIPQRDCVTQLVSDLNALFERPELTKQDIVKVISDYLPEFRHVETGRSLDGKL